MSEWQPPWPHNEDIKTFADRLRWIVREGYDDEGASAFLPLLTVALVLDLAARVVAEERVTAQWGLLRTALAILDRQR